MGNNIRRLRVAFLLTPTELANRMGADAFDIERIENENFTLGEEWVAAVSAALGVAPEAITDPLIDVDAVREAARATTGPVRRLCPIGARFAILALVAKFGGLKFAKRLDEDDLARAVQNVERFVSETEENNAEVRLSRLTLALRIAVLAILQSREAAPRIPQQGDLDDALQGASLLLDRFSRIATAA
jgi:hypothetical protein